MSSKLASKCLIFIASLAVVAMAYAQTNDVGAPNNPGLQGGPPLGTVVSVTFSNSKTQVGRINRDGIASSCPSKAYPGGFNQATTYNFTESFLFNNQPFPVCVTINFNPDTPAAGNACETNAHLSAYAGSYDPNNQATNFLGDIGLSSTGSFSFEAPANSRIILVAHNNGGGSGPEQEECTFEFSYDPGQLSAAPVAREVPTLSQYSMILVTLALLLVGFLALRRQAA